jgi:hypothetical protein
LNIWIHSLLYRIENKGIIAFIAIMFRNGTCPFNLRREQRILLKKEDLNDCKKKSL